MHLPAGTRPLAREGAAPPEQDRSPADPGRTEGPPPGGSRAARGKATRASQSSQRRQRILIASPQPFYEDRGTPIALRQVIEALSQLGYGVDVVTYPLGRTLDTPGLRCFRASNPFRLRRVPIGFSLRKLVLDASLVAALRDRLRRGGYFCVHAVEEAAFPAVLLGRRYGVPVIYDMQSSLPEQLATLRGLRNRPIQAVLRRLERWLLRNADLVVGSAGLSERVLGLHPSATFREWRYSSPIPRATPQDARALRHALGIPAATPLVLYCGSFATYQGLPELLAAVPAVRARVPATIFVLVGAEGADGASIARQAASLVQDGSVRLVERQPRDRIPAFLAMADVLVSPRAYGENLPLKIFDYLAAGKPIVATDLPAHRSVLGPSYAELVVPSAPDLAGAIVRVLLDPERAARLGAGARAYAENELGWTAFVRSVAELFDEVRARDGRPVAAA